jgi:serine/threonine-protein kinase PknG
LGAGLITLADLPSTDPERAVMLDPKVPERKRFCASCDSPLKREAGFCGKCGLKYNFVPSLKARDVVAGQYEVKGPIAFGGLGWIYLGFDKVLSRYVVLKGLLNTQDESAAAAAVAERQFLAAVKHPNIVGIYNFAQNGTEGFIVMEYVGGKTLKQMRRERGPLPVAEAVAYIHRILPAFGYLHRLGLVYCDFKPDNVMLEKDDVKLIDMGGVRRIDDTRGDIYGTVGYSAPEAGSGPTAASDVFTIGRTLAVLLTEIHGFNAEHIYSLPSPQEEPLFARHESLYRALLRATAHSPEDRFETAEEMAEQLLGVLREIVAVESGTPRPAPSLFFGADLLSLEAGDEMEPIQPDYRYLPLPSPDMEDPGAQAASHANALTDANKRLAALRLAVQQVPKSREARLRLAQTLSDLSAYQEAGDILKALGEEDAWDWRVLWFRGLMRLAEGDFAEARKSFDQVYFDLPGEVAPKLSLGLASELAGDLGVAIEMYDLVSRTDPGFVSAIFGLARCHQAKGDRKAAVAALDRIPQSSALYLRARIEAARILIRQDRATPGADELAAASSVAESLSLDGMSKFTLASQILGAALDVVRTRAVKETDTIQVLGNPLQEVRLRAGLEASLRSMARMVTGEERIRLVDRANQVRPRTLV